MRLRYDLKKHDHIGKSFARQINSSSIPTNSHLTITYSLKTLTLNPQTFAPLKSKKPRIIHCQLNEGAFVYTR